MNDDNIVLSYPLMARQREDKIKSNLVAYAEDVNAELDHMVDVHNQLVMMLNGEWSEDTGRIYQLMNQAITTANEAKAIADNCVKRSGDTMTGHLNSSLTPTSDYNLVNKAYVDDKVNTEVGSVEARVELLENFAENLEADQVKLDNTNFSSTNVHDGFSELFISVSNGKAIVAAAITGKGVETAADASFKTMADNINAILTFTEGTRGGTATNADIVYGKTAYARGQLLVGTLDLSHAYDTSDATATPYDIAVGKVAYGRAGRMVGILNMSGDKPSYDIGAVKKIYGYSDNYVYAGTKVSNVETGDVVAFGVDSLTGDVVCRVACKNNDDGTKSIITHRITRNGDYSFNYFNKKEHILQSNTPIDFATLGDIKEIQISDCRDEDNIYLHMVIENSDTDKASVVVIRLKDVGEEDGSGGTKHVWDLDTSKIWILKDFFTNLTYKGVKFYKIAISNMDGRNGRYAVLYADRSSSGSTTGKIISYRLNDSEDGTTSITKLGEKQTNGSADSATPSNGTYCHGYLGYNDRFCMFPGFDRSWFVWLNSAFQIQEISTYTNNKLISPDGQLLYDVSTRKIYDYTGVIDNMITPPDNLSTDGLTEIGQVTLDREGLGLPSSVSTYDWAWFSPSSNMIIKSLIDKPANDNYRRYFIVYKLNRNNKVNIVESAEVVGKDFLLTTERPNPRYQTMANSGSLFMEFGQPVSGIDNILSLERDYNVVIGLEYEGEMYYKAGYDGSLVVGGES